VKGSLWFVTALLISLLGFTGPAFTQEKRADNMGLLREKLKADKKLLVATNMELTESEAKGFWPVYEKYQKDLENMNQRMVRLLESYARRKGVARDPY